MVAARGGGHSYASFGLGGDDGALIVDLDNFRNIVVDDAGLATVGAGNRLGDIYLALDAQGWAFAAGTCPGVGIGGHAGFGGASDLSFGSRRIKLTFAFPLSVQDSACPRGSGDSLLTKSSGAS